MRVPFVALLSVIIVNNSSAALPDGLPNKTPSDNRRMSAPLGIAEHENQVELTDTVHPTPVTNSSKDPDTLTATRTVQNAWLKSKGDPGFDAKADLNADGVVNFLDLQLARERANAKGERGTTTIDVTITVDEAALIIGQTTTLHVFAEVTGGAVSSNGIFAYALNVLNDVSGIAGINSVIQLGAPDPFFSDPGTIDSSGLRDVYGGDGGFFADKDRGIGAAFELFTLEIVAVSEGAVSFADGVADSANLLGIATGFLVQQAGTVIVNFSAGVTLSITALDCNSNGTPDALELAGNDCNVNGSLDECDIAGATSEDCNSNAFPDECDIAGATSQDANTSGIPDECEIVDCNTNGVEDELDISGGTSEDCNTNAIPDECDIAAGTARGCLELSLHADADFYLPGQTVTITVDMSRPDAAILGGQFFIAYDTDALQFVSMVAGDSPFVQEIFEVLGLGTIDYAVGLLQGNAGTMNDTTMAVITFTADATVCDVADLVAFRPHSPPTVLTSAFGGLEQPVLVNLGPITIDGTVPSVFCPPDLSVECTDSINPGDTGGATANDNCGVSQVVTFQDDVSTTGCVGEFTITRTWQAVDETGNVNVCDQIISVHDTTAPVITCPPDVITNSTAGGCTATFDPGSANATDNCEPGLAPVGTREDGRPLVGEYDSGSLTISWEVADCAGNVDTCQQIVTVVDSQDPIITCPADIVVNADAGGTDAFVNIPPPPGIEDNCGIALLTNDSNGTANASGVYPQGDTIVTWTLGDVFGNVGQCTHTITVDPFNEVVVSVQLSPTVDASMDRCITFEFFDCVTEASTVVDAGISFNFGLALAQTILVPAGTWDCVSARDRLHTLRRTDESFRIVGTQYVADFTGDVNAGGDWLIGGNLNDDLFIDILDFAILSMEWAQQYDSDADMIPDGNTECGVTTSPHADITGNGLVTLGDFTFIQIHFLEQTETNCCGLGREGDDGPRTTITVKELRAMGFSLAALADWDGDDMVDVYDMMLLLGSLDEEQ